jgi:hypothetical protein
MDLYFNTKRECLLEEELNKIPTAAGINGNHIIPMYKMLQLIVRVTIDRLQNSVTNSLLKDGHPQLAGS